MSSGFDFSFISLSFRDAGNTVKLRPWSRGFFVTLRPGGHIEHWAPIYGGERPTEVFLRLIIFEYKIFIQAGILMVDRLKEHLKEIPPEEWHLHAICYDNICNVVSVTLYCTELLQTVTNCIFVTVLY